MYMHYSVIYWLEISVHDQFYAALYGLSNPFSSIHLFSSHSVSIRRFFNNAHEMSQIKVINFTTFQQTLIPFLKAVGSNFCEDSRHLKEPDILNLSTDEPSYGVLILFLIQPIQRDGLTSLSHANQMCPFGLN